MKLFFFATNFANGTNKKNNGNELL